MGMEQKLRIAAYDPPREPTLPELIERAWKAGLALNGYGEGPEWGRLNAEAFVAQCDLWDALFALGITRDLAKKMGELI